MMSNLDHRFGTAQHCSISGALGGIAPSSLLLGEKEQGGWMDGVQIGIRNSRRRVRDEIDEDEEEKRRTSPAAEGD